MDSLTEHPLYIFEIIAVILCVYILISHRRNADDPGRIKDYALCVSFLVAYVASNSWNIIAIGHMNHHVHMDSIIFYIPMMLIIYLIIGRFIQRIIADITHKQHTKKASNGSMLIKH